MHACHGYGGQGSLLCLVSCSPRAGRAWNAQAEEADQAARSLHTAALAHTRMGLDKQMQEKAQKREQEQVSGVSVCSSIRMLFSCYPGSQRNCCAVFVRSRICNACVMVG